MALPLGNRVSGCTWRALLPGCWVSGSSPVPGCCHSQVLGLLQLFMWALKIQVRSSCSQSRHGMHWGTVPAFWSPFSPRTLGSLPLPPSGEACMQAQMGMAALSATPRKETHTHVDVGLHVHSPPARASPVCADTAGLRNSRRSAEMLQIFESIAQPEEDLERQMVQG